MCWSETASVAMIGIGATATVVSAKQGHPKAIWLTLAYFTFMEVLQIGGYMVIDDCGSAANKSITVMSFLHIAFQPFVINAFMMELLPEHVRLRIRGWVYGLCGLAVLVMLAQLLPSDTYGTCNLDRGLCGEAFCTVTGDWHLAWEVPYNGFFNSYSVVVGDMPSYALSVFLLPVLYGAWRFAIFNAVIGPILSRALTSNPNEAPAIWCLFAIGILLVALSPKTRRFFEVKAWWSWPKSWHVSA